MKKLLLFLLISNFSFAQNGVEVRLVNANVGSPQCNYFFNDWLCNSTNDEGLNTILNNNGVSYFRAGEGHPYPPYQGRLFLISSAVNLAQLATDLTGYSSVIESAKISNDGTFTDTVRLQLVDLNVGTPNGFNGNIVTTNDSGLNLIFQNFSVFYYVQAYPSSTNNNILRYYTAVCNCDKNLLAAALNSYSPVIQATENIGAVYLSNHPVEKPKAIISPNPFSYNFDIQTDETIANYSIIDITGKTIIATSSKANLDNQSSQLSAGMYILNLDFDNGQKANYKLVKK